MIETIQVRINPFFVPSTERIILSASVNAECQKVEHIIFSLEQHSLKFPGIKPAGGEKIDATLPNIMERVCIFYGISVKDLIGRSKKPPIMRARNIYCAVSRQKTGLSYAQIAAMINRNHATAMNSCRTVKKSERKAINGNTMFQDYQKICAMFRNIHLTF